MDSCIDSMRTYVATHSIQPNMYTYASMHVEVYNTLEVINNEKITHWMERETVKPFHTGIIVSYNV